MESTHNSSTPLFPEEEAKQKVPPGPKCSWFENVEGIPMAEYELKRTERFRKDRDLKALREASKGIFLRFCPYWSRTDYGTIRCNYLGVEAVSMDDVLDWEKAREHFGSDEAVQAACTGERLADATKECNVNLSPAEPDMV